MGRVFLFAMIGGALVALVWLIGQSVWRKRRIDRLGRAQDEIAAERERFARLSPGGDPNNPIMVDAPSVVEPKAGSMPCVRCQGPVLVRDHQVRTVDGVRLRVAQVECNLCGFEREVFFRLSGRLQ